MEQEEYVVELGMWIFLSALIIGDTWQYINGYDTLLQKHKTPLEKELQKIKLGETKWKNYGSS